MQGINESGSRRCAWTTSPAPASSSFQVITEGTGQAFLRLQLRDQELLSQDPMLPGLRPVRASLVS
jgi:hypothetical protein